MRLSDIHWEYSDDLYREKLLEPSYFIFKYIGNDTYEPIAYRPTIKDATRLIDDELNKNPDPSSLDDYVIVRALNLAGARNEVKNKKFLTVNM